MDPGSGEYYKNKQWVDIFMRIPFKLPFVICLYPLKMVEKNVVILWKKPNKHLR